MLALSRRRANYLFIHTPLLIAEHPMNRTYVHGSLFCLPTSCSQIQIYCSTSLLYLRKSHTVFISKTLRMYDSMERKTNDCSIGW